MGTENEGLETIEDLVFNEKLTVTLSGLMRKLSVKSEDARSLLDKFVESNQKKEDLLVTYLISGAVHDGGFSYKLSTKNDLEAKKSEFKEVLQELIYSVQHGTEFNPLSLVDIVENNTSLNGAVVSKNCKTKVFKENVQAVPTRKNPVEKSSFGSKMVKEEPNKVKSSSSTSSNSNGKGTITKKNSGNIASMFASMPAKPVKKEANSPNKENKDKYNIEKSEKSEAGKNIKEENEDNNKIDDDSDVEMEVSKDKAKKPAKSQNASKSKKKRPRKDNNSDQVAKKRKRIIERNDSDSDDPFASDTSDIIEESDHEEKKIVARIDSPPPPCPKNKRRKQVEQTTEEDGFIVTTKVWVYESASEEEVEEPKKPVKQEIKAKTPPATKKIKKADSQEDVTTSKPSKKGKKAPPANQPTLMNFFSRK